MDSYCPLHPQQSRNRKRIQIFHRRIIFHHLFHRLIKFQKYRKIRLVKVCGKEGIARVKMAKMKNRFLMARDRISKLILTYITFSSTTNGKRLKNLAAPRSQKSNQAKIKSASQISKHKKERLIILEMKLCKLERYLSTKLSRMTPSPTVLHPMNSNVARLK